MELAMNPLVHGPLRRVSVSALPRAGDHRRVDSLMPRVRVTVLQRLVFGLALAATVIGAPRAWAQTIIKKEQAATTLQNSGNLVCYRTLSTAGWVALPIQSTVQ